MIILQTLTPTENDNSQKQSHVAVVQLQCVELDGELELRLHHLTERFPEALEELARHKNLSVGDKGPIFVHERRHHDDQNLDDSVLQQSNLKKNKTYIKTICFKMKVSSQQGLIIRTASKSSSAG